MLIENLVKTERSFLPFRNIRHVLSLHAKTAGNAPFLIYYDAQGQRQQLSYVEFNARAHQTANFLHDDLEVKRGDAVAILAPAHADTLLAYVACWIIGAVVVPLQADAIARQLNESGAVICLVHSDRLAEVKAVDAPAVRHIITMTGAMNGEHAHFNEFVRNLPMTYLGDGAQVKSADDTLKDLNDAVPTLSDAALWLDGIVITQQHLLAQAFGMTQAQAIFSGQRLIHAAPDGFIYTVITALLAGASVVLNQAFSVEGFWRQVVSDGLHIVEITPELLQALTDQAQAQLEAGNGLFGEGVHRRGLSHFRHFTCCGLTVQQARDFEDLFGLMVLSGYSSDATTGYSSLMPIDMTWEEHQDWLFGQGDLCIGQALLTTDLAIEDGLLVIRGHHITQQIAFHTQLGAYARQDAKGRQLVFLRGTP